MFIVEPFTVRWGNPDHTTYLVHIKQENDSEFFECIISKDDPCQEFADVYEKIVSGDYGGIGVYQEPEPMLVAPSGSTVYGPDDVIVGSDPPETETVVDSGTRVPATRLELWRVKRALRDVPATQAFRDYVASSGAEVRGSDGRAVALDHLSGLDQINIAISLTDNISLQDFWRDGIYVYDSSPNFAAFAQILGLTPDAVDALVARANTFVV